MELLKIILPAIIGVLSALVTTWVKDVYIKRKEVRTIYIKDAIQKCYFPIYCEFYQVLNTLKPGDLKEKFEPIVRNSGFYLNPNEIQAFCELLFMEKNVLIHSEELVEMAETMQRYRKEKVDSSVIQAYKQQCQAALQKLDQLTDHWFFKFGDFSRSITNEYEKLHQEFTKQNQQITTPSFNYLRISTESFEQAVKFIIFNYLN